MRERLIEMDWKKIGKNALIFAGPALLVFFADITKVLPDKLEGPYLVFALFGLNIITDAIRKFIAK